MNRRSSTAIALTAVGAGALALAGCSSDSGSSTAANTISVDSGDTTCTVNPTTANAGQMTFSIKNSGAQVSEFYVYAADGKSIVSEVENISPGTQRDLIATINPGSYVTACKPGMTGDGIRGTFTVTGSKQSSTAAQQTAVAQYTKYVQGQTKELSTRTAAFAAAYKAGNTAQAKALYASAREPYESIEPVAESFGDLDPKLDARVNDVEPGQQWTGWHRIEKDLWAPGGKPLNATQRAALADQLLADTQELQEKVNSGLDLDVSKIGNGAKELMDEVATSKVTGEEDRYSHTDLQDFQGNIDGAKAAFEALEPIVQANDAALVSKLNTEFANVQAMLNKYKRGSGYAPYTELTKAQVKELATQVDALSEPLSKLTTAASK